ncbi:DUF202 domain-containing protein [Halopenitus sp. H-Gu1]|uniref:DUF202 domain-containing protein n=1 Tax=Halopenitus sp. H-Gu1 TaxID=3242697 RepID=UPI00359DE8F9
MRPHQQDEATQKATELVEERARLAQERTILAHTRTGFASFLFGTAIIGLFTSVKTEVVGRGFILTGVLFLNTGARSYLSSNRRIRHPLEEVEHSVWGF